MADQTKKNTAWHYAIILLVFAVTGSTAAVFPRFIMPLTGLESGTFWYVFWYIILITPIYQVLLLGYAFVFGKFQYFYQKQKKLFRWIGGLFTRRDKAGREKVEV